MTNVKYDSVVEEAFINFLNERNFPSEAVVYHPFLPSSNAARYIPDIGILDAKTKEFAAVIEVKGYLSEQTLHQADAKMKEYLKKIDKPSLKGYLAFYEAAAGNFTIYLVARDESEEAIVFPNLSFEYPNLVSAFSSEKTEEFSAEKIKTSNDFSTYCHVLASVLCILFVLDLLLRECWKINLLTTERLAVLGACCVLFLAPFVQKIKALGFEIERQGKD